jgi:hypothetical protein
MVPKFAGSNPAETVGFFGRKNPQHAFLRSHVAVLGHVKEPYNYRGSRNCRQNLIGHFSPIVHPLANRGLSRRLMWSVSGDEEGEPRSGVSTINLGRLHYIR